MCLFYFFGRTHHIWKFVSQELNLSQSCSNTGSFNPLWQAGDRTCTSAATWAAAVRFLTHWATVGTPEMFFLREEFYLKETSPKIILKDEQLKQKALPVTEHKLSIHFVQIWDWILPTWWGQGDKLPSPWNLKWQSRRLKVGHIQLSFWK